jgi:hypothetical protein
MKSKSFLLILVIVLLGLFLPVFFPRQTLKNVYITPNTLDSEIPVVRDWWNPINPTFIAVEESEKNGKKDQIIGVV